MCARCRPSANWPACDYLVQDVRDLALSDTLALHQIDTVVHLASIVTPGKGSNRAFEYSVDVGGTQNVLERLRGHRACSIWWSPAAARPMATTPTTPPGSPRRDALRGNEVFAYSHHKRLVEEMLARYRAAHPALAQTVLRIGTILGEQVDNQITALFEKPRLIAIRGSDSPFVFIWNEDVTGADLARRCGTRRAGLLQPGGRWRADHPRDCTASGQAHAASCPRACCSAALWLGSTLGVSRYGPEQLDFLRYRPVLLNTALKEVFGYMPSKTSAEAFDAFVAARAAPRAAR